MDCAWEIHSWREAKKICPSSVLIEMKNVPRCHSKLKEVLKFLKTVMSFGKKFCWKDQMLGEMPCSFDLEQKSVTIWIFNSNRTEEVKKAFYSFICLTYEFVKSSRDTRSFYGQANMATWDWKKIWFGEGHSHIKRSANCYCWWSRQVSKLEWMNLVWVCSF